jgi:hypothetical protein
MLKLLLGVLFIIYIDYIIENYISHNFEDSIKLSEQNKKKGKDMNGLRFFSFPELA